MLKQFSSLQSCLRPPGPAPAHKTVRRTTPGRRNDVQPHVQIRYYGPDGILEKWTYGAGGCRRIFDPTKKVRKKYYTSANLVAEGIAIARAK